MQCIRSLLFVPAEEKTIKKIGTIKADAYIIDLEDSISENEKDEALLKTIDFLNNNKLKNIYVRINPTRKKIELNALERFQIGFMLPKIENEDEYEEYKNILESHNVIVLIESASALINVNHIASLSWVNALAFGAEDFTKSTNFSNDIESLFLPKSMISIAAKANRKLVYDTPCFYIKNDNVLNSELKIAKKLGYDGKLAIHPCQVPLIENAFNYFDTKKMEYIINKYEENNKAVCEIDGKVYEKMHIEQLKEQLL